MHLNDYSIGDQVELTKDVCESKKGELGVIYGTDEHKAIRMRNGTALVTGHIKLVSAAPSDNHEIVKRLTAAMMEADKSHERVGGGTKHHVRDCLLPVLKKHGLKIECLNIGEGN